MNWGRGERKSIFTATKTGTWPSFAVRVRMLSAFLRAGMTVVATLPHGKPHAKCPSLPTTAEVVEPAT